MAAQGMETMGNGPAERATVKAAMATPQVVLLAVGMAAMASFKLFLLLRGGDEER